MRFKYEKNSLKLYGTILLFIMLLTLCWLFPYTLDDWAWGSQVGIDRWNTRFKNYSGRYIGNIIVLVLTRFRILKAVTISLSIMIIAKIIEKISGSGNTVSLFVILLLFLSPKPIFRQCIAWTSGFSNYFISILLFLLYILIIKYIFENKTINKENLLLNVCILILGYISSMIVEHVTIMQIVLGGIILILESGKNKKINIPAFVYFIGSIAGAITMFSNECYSSSLAGTDSYRSVATNETGFFYKIFSNYFNIIGKQMILDNIILELFICVITIIFFIQNYDVLKPHKNIKKTSLILIVFSVFYGLVTRINPSWDRAYNCGKYIDGCINIIFWCGLLSFTILMVTDIKKRAKMILCLVGIACANGSLLLVSPVSSRCFFVTYVLTIWYCAECMTMIIIKKDIKELILKSLVSALIFILCMNFAIYGSVYKEDNKQLENIRQAEKEGKTDVTIPILTYEDYLHGARMHDMWEERYKLFYGISQDIKINYD